MTTIGSLCSGYGGLEQGLALALGGDVRTAWHVEYDKHPSAILAHRYPDVPNYGDVTKVDWAGIEPVDALTGGFPCQDVSHAGLRKGLGKGTRTGIWSSIAVGIGVLRPRLVLLENVGGLLSARADSNVEPCPWCLGDGTDVPHLRALGAVLGDLSDLGYVGRYRAVRASDAGAPHGRLRVFIVAEPAPDARGERHGRGQDPRALGRLDGPDAGEARERERARARGVAVDRGAAVAADCLAQDSDGAARGERRVATPGQAQGGGARADAGLEVEHLLAERRSLLPTPRATDGEKGGPNQRGSSGDLMLPSAVQVFLPTPQARDWKDAGPSAAAKARKSPPIVVLFDGAPTPPPSTAGKPSPDDQLPGQLSLDGTAND